MRCAAISPELRRVAIGRALIGALVLARTTSLGVLVGRGWAGGPPLLGWPDGAWHGVPAGVALPAAVVALLCVVRTVATMAFTVGYHARSSACAVALAGYLVALQRPMEFTGTIHLLLLSTFVVGCVDSSAAFAVKPASPRAADSSQWLLRVFVASIYFWSGLAKLGPDWLSGRTLSMHVRTGAAAGALADAAVATLTRARVAAVGVVALELALAPLLLWRRTRPAAIAVALAFHAGLEMAVKPDLFGWAMAVLLVACWPAQRESHATAAGGETMSAALHISSVVLGPGKT